MTSKKRTGNDPGEKVGPRKSLTGRIGTGGLAEASAEAVSSGSRKGSSEYQQGRRSMAYEMADQGLLTSARLGMEILYLLPDAFLEYYAYIYHQALRLGDESVMHGRSGGLDKAAGQKGMALGSDTQLQASGSGKKWKNTAMVVGSDKALTVKSRIDQGLIELTRQAQDLYRELMVRDQELRDQPAAGVRTQGQGALNKVNQPAQSGSTRNIQCQGQRELGKSVTGMGLGGIEVSMTRKCGKFLQANWAYCPSCGSKVGQGRDDGMRSG